MRLHPQPLPSGAQCCSSQPRQCCLLLQCVLGHFLAMHVHPRTGVWYFCVLRGYDTELLLCTQKAPSGRRSPRDAERQNLRKPNLNTTLRVLTVNPSEKASRAETSRPDSRSPAPSKGPKPILKPGLPERRRRKAPHCRLGVAALRQPRSVGRANVARSGKPPRRYSRARPR